MGEGLAVGRAEEGTVRLLQIANGRFSSEGEYKLAESGINDLAFSPNGQHLAFGTNDGTVGIWEVGASHPRYIIEGN
jgi:WD40 repeat protein